MYFVIVVMIIVVKVMNSVDFMICYGFNFINFNDFVFKLEVNMVEF